MCTESSAPTYNCSSLPIVQRTLVALLAVLLGACLEGMPNGLNWCTPTTCEQAGKDCGVISDGCSGTVECGTCSGADTCGGGGVGNVCGVGTCTPTTCAAQGKDCGVISDGCGATLDCGGCSGADTCGGGGTPNVCGAPTCLAWTCADQGANCGNVSDGCGGTLFCGGCSGSATCGGGGTPNVCGSSSTTPTPSCSDGIRNGNETGVDCGGSCSACPTTSSCSDGIQNGNETGVDCGGSCSACPTNTCTPATYEAETMYQSVGASETGGWNLWGNGYVSTDATFAGGSTTVTVVAYGDPSGGVYPHMIVSIDGTSIGDTTVDSTSWTSYDFTASVTAGTHELRVAFDNDACCTGGDRNLYVDKVTVGCSGGSSSSTPSCSDGIRNGNETGVDCGGSCAACPTTASCSDGIQNGNETGVDCGGSCTPCPTTSSCFDGIQNGNETGVDCGGSCGACNSNNTGTVRIMPLGDSITEGSSGGYRNGLWNSLTGAGYSIDYVGSLNDQYTQVPDHDHEGHPGWTTYDITGSIDGWISSYAPDYVLLMIGTNDVAWWCADTGAQVADRTAALVDRILADRPSAWVIVSSIPPEASQTIAPNNVNRAQLTRDYNAALYTRMQSRINAGAHVRWVDSYSVLTVSDLYDGIHPTDHGYNLIAQVWYQGLLPLLH